MKTFGGVEWKCNSIYSKSRRWWRASVFKGFIIVRSYDFKMHLFARHEVQTFMFDTECSRFITL